MTDFDPIPYRIRIGVTGHRTLPDPDQTREQVRLALNTVLPKLFSETGLRKIERMHGLGTTPIAYSVLSPLAEGADRAVARAVLDYPGARLDIVLPLDPQEYRRDFDTQASREEFDTLLSQCRHPVVLPGQTGAGDPRTAAYEAAGQFVVDQCDVLIAVWNGEPSKGRGGTAEIVEYARQQERPVIRVWEETASIIHRGNGLDVATLDIIDRFNTTSISPEAAERCRVDIARDYFSSPSAAMLGANQTFQTAKELMERLLVPCYIKASVLAERNQKRFYSAGYSTYGLSAIAVACVALAVLAPGWATVGYSLELVFLLLIVFHVLRSRFQHSHQFWMENRFLTERLRCGAFLALCGVDAEPIAILPFMGHAHSVNDWTVRVFDEIWNRLPKLSPCTQAQCGALSRYIGETWIGGQERYHATKQRDEKHSRERLERIGNIVLPATILAAMLHLAPVGFSGLEWDSWFHNALTMIALVFPPIAAALAGVLAFREHLRLEKRSANMVPQLRKLQAKMLSAHDPHRFAAVLRQMDEIMLRESQDWLMLMRDVEIKSG
jgi:hypothetical protein